MCLQYSCLFCQVHLYLPFGRHASSMSWSSNAVTVRLSSETCLNIGSYWLKSLEFLLGTVPLLLLLMWRPAPAAVMKHRKFTKVLSTNMKEFQLKLANLFDHTSGKDWPDDGRSEVHHSHPEVTGRWLRKHSEGECDLLARLESRGKNHHLPTIKAHAEAHLELQSMVTISLYTIYFLREKVVVKLRKLSAIYFKL